MNLRKIGKCLVVLVCVVSLTVIFGCQIIEDDTGHHIRLNPFIHKQVGDVAQTGVGILGILSMFIPALAPVAAAGATGTYVWKRMGKKVTKYQTPLRHTVNVLEMIKRDTKLWGRLKPYMKGTAKNVWEKPSAKTEATIRELIDEDNEAV